MTDNVILEGSISPTETDRDDLSTSKVQNAGESPVESIHNINKTAFESSDDETATPVYKTKKRVKKFSDSDSDGSDENGSGGAGISKPNNSDSESSMVFKSGPSKSRIRKVASDDDSDDENKLASKAYDESSNDKGSKLVIKNQTKKSRLRKPASADDDSDNTQSFMATKNEEQQLRMVNKKNKLRDKFKSLLTSREKNAETQDKESDEEYIEDNTVNEDSDISDDEKSSIDKIKQKIKERSASIKMTICDPDTSDEENSKNKNTYKPKKDQKRTKMTSPKPQRMSAKEAMENMKKIKGESNRMLREREVSLPYHRPKALSLQDIMKRRRPAVSSDGKVLPIKMNEEQLKQYAHSLEQRQKEMMELCKSESEEEEDDHNDLENTAISKTSDVAEQFADENGLGITELSDQSDVLLINGGKDVINQDHNEANGTKERSNDSEKEPVTLETTMDNDNKLEQNCLEKSGDISAEMELVYNDSVEDSNTLHEISKENIEGVEYCEHIRKTDMDLDSNNSNTENAAEIEKNKVEADKQCNTVKRNKEIESQFISLHYDSELTENIQVNSTKQDTITEDRCDKSNEHVEMKDSVEEQEADDFLDDDMDMNDINMEDIDTIIENAESTKDTVHCGFADSPALVRDIPVLNVKPKLTGAPGMVIDLDGSDPIAPKKLTGVELLKERFTFFAKLKTPEEMEREREKRQKPGTQHLKLKQQLEDIIAEQRSLEWSKRLESEKQHQMELDAIRGDASDEEDDIDKIEAKLEGKEIEIESSTESEEEDEDLLENDVLIEDKPKKKNPLVADEAEESDVEDTEDNCEKEADENINEDSNDDGVQGDDDISEGDSSEDEESSESEDESEVKPRKGRILKAFEDSDDEDASKLIEKDETVGNKVNDDTKYNNTDNIAVGDKLSQSQSYGIMDSQDDVIQLAQVQKQLSSDVFTSQGSGNINTQGKLSTLDTSKDDEDLGTQTFSIMNATKIVKDIDDPDKLTVISDDSDKFINSSVDIDKQTVISETQPNNDDNLDAVVGMCSGSFQTQNCIGIDLPSTQTQMSQSQAIGEDLLDMCTGKFYDNEFVSPNEEHMNVSDDMTQQQTPINKSQEAAPDIEEKEKEKQEDLLKSVLEELHEPDYESKKSLKFFSDGKSQNKENEPNVSNTQVKKRFVIESDEETNHNTENSKQKKKKFKKKKLEKRALHISDDEEEYEELGEEDDYLSENEDDIGNDNEEERLVEYDSEENEVEVKIKPKSIKKKKRKATEFFEQEAELTSEDEWVGSGDEDEAGLDRMEREEGDDETFHQGQLQRELGQIHMRDVLDQDKREVRLIQELLFEDGDLGGGGRQRKFRWRNADGEEASGTVPDELADTQEEEFESEEQWRKQRHEREMFLRQMNNEEKEDELNVSLNRTSIIKANLCSRTMSSLLEEAQQSKTVAPKATAAPEKKTAKDIPSPAKKPFTMFQQNYHGSLLTRGQGALARLAALATPLAADDDAPKIGLLAPSSKRNFVFATVTPDKAEPKVTKRKAESHVGTPRLVKKMKTEEKQNRTKSSLLEFLKT